MLGTIEQLAGKCHLEIWISFLLDKNELKQLNLRDYFPCVYWEVDRKGCNRDYPSLGSRWNWEDVPQKWC